MKRYWLVLGVIWLPLGSALGDPLSLKVMSYNIWMGGDHQAPLNATLSVLRKGDADLIGIQEADSNGKRLAQGLGYHWYPVKEGVRPGGVLSRFPATKIYSQGIEITTPTGQTVNIFSVHLLSDPYEPYDLQDKKLSVSGAVDSARRGRVPEIQQILGEIQPIAASGTPVFLVGDFNEPSHLDWTTRALRLHRWAVPWPTSLAVLGSGFSDAFRTLHPDETTDLGYTWTPLRSSGEIHDRIDFVYFKGDTVSVQKVDIIGEKGGPEVAIVGHDPYPSDHRAVLGHFQIGK